MSFDSGQLGVVNATAARQGDRGPYLSIILVLFAHLMLAYVLMGGDETVVSSAQLLRPASGTGFPVAVLAMTRALSAGVACFTMGNVLFGPPLTIHTKYDKRSAIQGPIPIKISGLARLSTFTCLSWFVLTCYFTVTACLTVASATTAELPTVPAWLCYALWVAYEVSFAVSMQVTAITTFVLMPGAVRLGDKTAVGLLFRWKGQVMHNCNLFFMATELLLNDMPLVPLHFVYPMLYGLSYVVFSWLWLRGAGVVYYPFLDPTLPWVESVLIHCGLAAAFPFFFFIGIGVAAAGAWVPFPVRILLVYLACWGMTHTIWHKRPVLREGGEVDEGKRDMSLLTSVCTIFPFVARMLPKKQE